MIPRETLFRSRGFQGKMSLMLRQLAAAVVLLAWTVSSGTVSAQIRLADESDRAAFRNWFVLLADA